MRFLGLLLYLLMLTPNLIADSYGEVVWPNGDSAAAWQTKKTMFLFKSDEPVGMNRGLNVSIRGSANSKVITVEIPINKFDSGEESRDKDVALLLKVDKQQNLKFTSEEIDNSDWMALLSGEKKDILGKLNIGGEDFTVVFSSYISGKKGDQCLMGTFKGKFSDFKLEAPSVAGGMVAKVNDELLLHYKIRLSVLGE